MTATNAQLLKALDNMTTRSLNLQGEVGKLSKELSALSDYGRRSRVFIRMMVISIVLDIGISAGLGIVAVSNYNLAEQAHVASSSTVVSCVSANESAKTQKELWEFLFTFPPPPDETAAAKAQRLRTTVQFKEYLAKAFVQRDCKGA